MCVVLFEARTHWTLPLHPKPEYEAVGLAVLYTRT